MNMDLDALLDNLAMRAKQDEAFWRELQDDPDSVVKRETGMTLRELWQQVEQQLLSDQELTAVTGGLGPGRPGETDRWNVSLERGAQLKIGEPVASLLSVLRRYL